MEIVTASAPGKIILFGEHSVVHRMPAIAIAVNKQTTVTIDQNESLTENEIFFNATDYHRSYKISTENLQHDSLTPINQFFLPFCVIIREILSKNNFTIPYGARITISSNIPKGAGMGSSASVSVALAKAFTEFLGSSVSNDEISSLAYRGEQIIHGTPSGIDNSVCTFGGGILFENGNITKIPIPDISIIVGDTGKPRQTKKLVEKVGFLNKKWDFYKEIITAIGSLVRESIPLLENGDGVGLGELCSINHGLLEALGVSSPELNHLVEAAQAAGAWGAKLTGGGGGGCMIALTSDNRVKDVKNAIINAGGHPYQMKFAQKGVSIQKSEKEN
ncbi:MAG: mevalonate kinase [Candidatus Thorarchaeota archaeon]